MSKPGLCGLGETAILQESPRVAAGTGVLRWPNLFGSKFARNLGKYFGVALRGGDPWASHRQAREATSNQLDDPPLRVGMRFDVSLGSRER